MADLYASMGATSDIVETYTNAAGVPRATPIIGIVAERGTFVRILNSVSRGEQEVGVPIYMDLRDSNGDPLPTNTEVEIEIERAGAKDTLLYGKLEQISHYNQSTISEQRNVDNVDAAKVVLEYPDSAPQSGPVSHVDIRDVDDAFISIDSAAEIDWNNSEIYVDSSAVKEGSR
ncbi:hypothetical protein [Haloparvum sedimenti]|uniref:hypothetical protein n=1 Tax=Haloparvum sedimenti TaxID=1678448 RepID=UPI00071E94CA|nr:hypothetical protein [Haloparvum sedimenti]